MIINNFWTIIVVVALMLGGLVYFCIKNEEKYSDSFVAIIIGTLTALIITSPVICLLLYTVCTTTTTKTYNENKELVSVNDYISTNQKLEGAFFLGIGGVSGDSKSEYTVVYAYKDESGIIRPKTQSVDKGQIGFKEDGLNTLEITYEKTTMKHDKVGSWLFKGSGEKEIGTKAVDYIFHVPEKSIIKDSKIDLK
jgi:heme/copper-type cytochrome/quinol oxidase subunit 2